MALVENCSLGIENKTRIDGMESDIIETKVAINDIRDKLLGRPSWVVLFLFTLMSSAIVGLLIMQVRGHI